jgi:hypothetical protein
VAAKAIANARMRVADEFATGLGQTLVLFAITSEVQRRSTHAFDVEAVPERPVGHPQASVSAAPKVRLIHNRGTNRCGWFTRATARPPAGEIRFAEVRFGAVERYSVP